MRSSAISQILEDILTMFLNRPQETIAEMWQHMVTIQQCIACRLMANTHINPLSRNDIVVMALSWIYIYIFLLHTATF